MPDGKVSGLGGPEGRVVMRTLRSRFDSVMIGAGTLRAEKISPNADPPEAPQPLPVILTTSGDVPLENLLDPAREPLILKTGTGENPVQEACELLFAEHSVGALLLEGGPTLNQAFLRQNLADEFFLTLSPKLLGGPPASRTILAGPLLSAPPHPEMLSAHLAYNRLFLRYALRAPQIAYLGP